MSELQTIVKLFQDAPAGSRPRQSLKSVLAIQKRAQERFDAQVPPPNNILSDMSAACGIPSVESSTPDFDEGQEHVPMLGWDTRLVRRLRAGAQADEYTIPKSGEPKRSTEPSPGMVAPSFWSPMGPPSVPASMATLVGANAVPTDVQPGLDTPINPLRVSQRRVSS